MCFSAPVSFAASGVLGIVGIFLVLHTKSKRLLPLALIPCIFSFQQAAEGFIWIYFPNALFWMNVFLFFANFFWPIWIPFALRIAEQKNTRKEFISLCTGIGIASGLYYFSLIPEETLEYHCSSLYYVTPTHMSCLTSGVMIFLYMSAVIISCLISSLKTISICGLVSLAGAVVIFLIDRMFFISTWCFFMAFVSLMMVMVIKFNDN